MADQAIVTMRAHTYGYYKEIERTGNGIWKLLEGVQAGMALRRQSVNVKFHVLKMEREALRSLRMANETEEEDRVRELAVRLKRSASGFARLSEELGLLEYSREAGLDPIQKITSSIKGYAGDSLFFKALKSRFPEGLVRRMNRFASDFLPTEDARSAISSISITYERMSDMDVCAPKCENFEQELRLAAAELFPGKYMLSWGHNGKKSEYCLEMLSDGALLRLDGTKVRSTGRLDVNGDGGVVDRSYVSALKRMFKQGRLDYEAFRSAARNEGLRFWNSIMHFDVESLDPEDCVFQLAAFTSPEGKLQHITQAVIAVDRLDHERFQWEDKKAVLVLTIPDGTIALLRTVGPDLRFWDFNFDGQFRLEPINKSELWESHSF